MKRVRRIKEDSGCTMFSMSMEDNEKNYTASFIDCKIQVRYWKFWVTVKKYTIKIKSYDNLIVSCIAKYNNKSVK